MQNLKYVTTKRIDKTDAQYRIFIGLRSNGKTSASLESSLRHCVKNGTGLSTLCTEPFAYLSHLVTVLSLPPRNADLALSNKFLTPLYVSK